MAVSALDGRRFVPVRVGSGEARQVGVSQWVEGEILWALVEAADGNQRARFFTELGRIAAQIHNQAVGWELSGSFVATRSTLTDSSASRLSGAASGRCLGSKRPNGD